eukprot:1378120-Rhodomonas_salina.1
MTPSHVEACSSSTPHPPESETVDSQTKSNPVQSEVSGPASHDSPDLTSDQLDEHPIQRSASSPEARQHRNRQVGHFIGNAKDFPLLSMASSEEEGDTMAMPPPTRYVRKRDQKLSSQ